MPLSVECSLSYQVLSPAAHFTFNILAAVDAHQRTESEHLELRPGVPLEHVTTSKGNRVMRAAVEAGMFELKYAATLDVSRPVLPIQVVADDFGRVPLHVLTYLLPSRYCESDRLASQAWELFGKIENRAEQVREICRWVDEHLEYAPGATDSRTSAWDVWQLRKGVCRDYTHLAIALCRALNIPARYVSGYAAGLEPMDFHACFEAYIGGHWYLFDPTDQLAADRIAVISRGRDAANAPLTTIFGRVINGAVKVRCEFVPVGGAPEAESSAVPAA
ncbi:transglutaminase [Nibricoccus aquaticus]|uniref:Transglutaminase n=1 Tax=Nibricoccus aquaticus TaxID=2576891 RepID=A0A290QD96_9BACT|nr:transglutaminase family protein [Nibricoccus aquaticus]ATC64226.1 transglutaminase [Nibricoccus aquaticus]